LVCKIRAWGVGGEARIVAACVKPVWRRPATPKCFVKRRGGDAGAVAINDIRLAEREGVRAVLRVYVLRLPVPYLGHYLSECTPEWGRVTQAAATKKGLRILREYP